MNWGKKILIAYIIFILGIASLVFISMKQKVDLVTDNYYEKELAYQEQINKKKRTQSLKESIMIKKINTELHISFPSDAIPKSGEVTLYRPSDNTEDKIFSLKENEKEQVISLNGLQPGLWKVVIYWRTNGTEYLNEETFFM